MGNVVGLLIKKSLKVTAVLFSIIFILASLFTAWVIYTPWGAKALVREISKRALGSHRVSWAKMEGSLASGIRVAHLEVREIPKFPSGNFLRLQSFAIRLKSFTIDGFEVDIEHGRFFPYGDESIVLDARIRGMSFSASAYTHSLDLGGVREILLQFFDVVPMKGVLRDIDLTAGGTFLRPWVKGSFIAEKIIQNEFTLEESPVKAGLRFIRNPSRWETYGRLDLSGGRLQGPVVRIDLLESRLTFTGRPSKPELDINATSRVARTRIDITVKGTRDEPKIFLASDAPYPKEQLLLMLATGRRWSGMDVAVGQNRMTTQLASSFVEYLLFGGSRKQVIEWFGLNDVSFLAEEGAQGVSVSKDVTERIGLGYGVVVRSGTADRAREVTQTLASDYQLTDRLTVTAQKELKSSYPVSEAESSDPLAIPDDRVFLRYRSRF